MSTATAAATNRRALTQDEAADAVGVSLRTIQRAVAAGELHAKNVGRGKRRAPRISVKELDRWYDALPDA
jgi:excisionase family DNA binding protein